MKYEDTHLPLSSFKVSAPHEGGAGNERLLNYLAVNCRSTEISVFLSV